jgi:cyclopropane fatty-acyl-phospholipid synthase-like methyltransferase
VRSAVPPYFDQLIDGFSRGHTGRHVHLGYWDAPPPANAPCSAADFEAAQARLCEVLIGLAGLSNGQRVLDVGCGFGGTLATINERSRDMRLVGINIDARQIDICRSIAPAATNSMSFVVADACALPVARGSFDRVVCLEAMFHFASRAEFFHQAAAALQPGGRLAVSDILLRNPGAQAPVAVALLEQIMRRDYGPWPELWIDADQIVDDARRSGLMLEKIIDATAQTIPNYRVTAPGDEAAVASRPSAGRLMRWLHENGYLSYAFFSFIKT